MTPTILHSIQCKHSNDNINIDNINDNYDNNKNNNSFVF